MNRLGKKYDTARKYVPKPIVKKEAKAKIGIIAYGSSDCAVEESRDQLKQANIETSYLRLRAVPFTEELKKFVDEHERIYVVEQNRDAQMRDLIRLEMPAEATKLRSVRHFDGLPIDARFISQAIIDQER